MTNPQTCQLDCDLCRLCVESGGWERLQKPIGDVGEERSLVAGAASNIFLLSGKPKSGDSARTNYIQVSVVSRLNSCNTTHTYYIRNTYFPMRGSFVSVCHITSVSPPKLLDDTVTKKNLSANIFKGVWHWNPGVAAGLQPQPQVYAVLLRPARQQHHRGGLVSGQVRYTKYRIEGLPLFFLYVVRHWKFTGKLNKSLIVAL